MQEHKYMNAVYERSIWTHMNAVYERIWTHMNAVMQEHKYMNAYERSNART
jgi:hypothetical protein